MKTSVYYIFKTFSLVALCIAALLALGLVTYPLYLLYIYFSKPVFESPIPFNQYCGMAGVLLISVVGYIITESIALDQIDYNDDSEF